MKITNGLVFQQNGTFAPQDVHIAEGRFAPHSEGSVVDATDCYVVPGFVDVHTHGAVNYDFSDGNPHGVQSIARFFAQNGTTSFLATTMTLAEDVLTKAVATIGDFVPQEGQASCLGVHLEGPFLTGSKKGAQAGEFLLAPSQDMFFRLQAASQNTVKLISMAPENQGGIDFVRTVSDKCAVSLGHTAALYDTAKEAFEAGADHVTHTYNAMNPIHHRDPAVIGAACDAGAYAELICDGIHVHPSTIRLTQKMFGDKLVLISDSIRSTGMPDGEYTLGGQPVFVKDGKCLMADGTIAGSTITLHDALVRSVSFGLPLETVIYALTMAPAKSVRMDHLVGSIAEGKQGDCVILNRDLSIRHVVVRGNLVQ